MCKKEDENLFYKNLVYKYESEVMRLNEYITLQKETIERLREVSGDRFDKINKLEEIISSKNVHIIHLNQQLIKKDENDPDLMYKKFTLSAKDFIDLSLEKDKKIELLEKQLDSVNESYKECLQVNKKLIDQSKMYVFESRSESFIPYKDHKSILNEAVERHNQEIQEKDIEIRYLIVKLRDLRRVNNMCGECMDKFMETLSDKVKEEISLPF